MKLKGVYLLVLYSIYIFTLKLFPNYLAVFIQERSGAAVPCFLRKFSLPLQRAGQQLQVLIKLLELCRWVCPGDQTYKDILPYWNDASSDRLYNLSPLTFSKKSIEEMEAVRENMYRVMQERLQIRFTKLDIKYQQISCSVRRHFFIACS